MLTDLGLQTPEQIKIYDDFNKARTQGMLNGTWPGGCVDKAICEKCKHLIQDSLCLCSGAFTCPNCGYKNGFNYFVGEAMKISELPEICSGDYSISLPTLQGRLSHPLTTELEALQQLEQCVPLSEEGKEKLRKLLE